MAVARRVLFRLACLVVMMTASQAAQASGELVIYLHNAWYESHKDGTPHPKFGPYHLDKIHEALKGEGAFLAPARNAGADPVEAAEEVVTLIQTEIAGGRSASDIKVVGASKGGVIAMIASTTLKVPDIRWVIIAGCSKGALETYSPKLTGRVLSIYDTSDTVAGPCPRDKDLTTSTVEFDEIRTETGLDHGFLFGPDPVWVKPARDW